MTRTVDDPSMFVKVTDMINYLYREIEEAEWLGQYQRADQLKEELGFYYKLQEKGILYEPLF